MKKKNCLDLIQRDTVYKRKLNKKRDIRSAVRGETARMAIGEIYSGCEIYGFTKGQFCLIHIIEHVRIYKQALRQRKGVRETLPGRPH